MITETPSVKCEIAALTQVLGIVYRFASLKSSVQTLSDISGK